MSTLHAVGTAQLYVLPDQKARVDDALCRTFYQMELATWASATLSCLAVVRPDQRLGCR